MKQAVVLAISLAMVVVSSGCLESLLGDPDYEEDEAIFATLSSTKSSSGDYSVTVTDAKMTYRFYTDEIKEYELKSFSYNLKDEDGYTNEFGEIAMQNLSGNMVGIDASYENKCGGSCEDDLLALSDDVKNDNGTNYAVVFYDNDREGILTAGDKFTVRGEGDSSHGPARDGWSIEVKLDDTGDVIGSIQLD